MGEVVDVDGAAARDERFAADRADGACRQTSRGFRDVNRLRWMVGAQGHNERRLAMRLAVRKQFCSIRHDREITGPSRTVEYGVGVAEMRATQWLPTTSARTIFGIKQ